MALTGHANGAEQCLLSEVKRTWLKDGVMSAYDPKLTPVASSRPVVKQLAYLLTDPSRPSLELVINLRTAKSPGVGKTEPAAP
jgi:hypothetical protein